MQNLRFIKLKKKKKFQLKNHTKKHNKSEKYNKKLMKNKIRLNKKTKQCRQIIIKKKAI